MGGIALAVGHDLHGVEDDDEGREGGMVGGKGERSGGVVCAPQPRFKQLHTTSQMLENQRKQICSSQADEYTYKLPTNTPTPSRHLLCAAPRARAASLSDRCLILLFRRALLLKMK